MKEIMEERELNDVSFCWRDMKVIKNGYPRKITSV